MPDTVLDSTDIKKIDIFFAKSLPDIEWLFQWYATMLLHSNSPSIFDFYKSLHPSEFHTSFLFHESKLWSMIMNAGIFKVDYKKKGTKKHYTLYIKLYLHTESQLISTKVTEDNLSNDSIHRCPELLLTDLNL